jgi:hypothetical protein
MRFLLDMGISPSTADFLNRSGHEASRRRVLLGLVGRDGIELGAQAALGVPQVVGLL